MACLEGLSEEILLVVFLAITVEIKHLISDVKQGGGGVIIWDFFFFFATTGPGHLSVIESTMSSSVHQSILESHVST